jgi:hypothetical protein
MPHRYPVSFEGDAAAAHKPTGVDNDRATANNMEPRSSGEPVDWLFGGPQLGIYET